MKKNIKISILFFILLSITFIFFYYYNKKIDFSETNTIKIIKKTDIIKNSENPI